MQSYLTIRLQLQGFGDAEFQKLDSILALAEARMDYLWTLGHGADADVVLVSDISLLPKDESRPCIYYVNASENDSENPPCNNTWSLIVDDHQVPHLWQLTKVFNAVAEHLNPLPEISAAEDETADSPVQSPVLDKISPAESVSQLNSPTTGNYKGTLLDLLQPTVDASTDKVFRVCFSTGESISVDLGRDLYFCQQPIETLEPYFCETIPFEVRSVSVYSLEAEVDELGIVGQPLSHLRWYIALTSPSLHLLDQLSDKTVKLKRWPDMGLPGCTPLIRLAAFMQSNEASVVTIAEKTKMPEAKVCAFLNACVQEDLVIYGDQETIHEKPVADEFKTLLSRISERINAE